jgi:hypothetical protein
VLGHYDGPATPRPLGISTPSQTQPISRRLCLQNAHTSTGTLLCGGARRAPAVVSALRPPKIRACRNASSGCRSSGLTTSLHYQAKDRNRCDSAPVFPSGPSFHQKIQPTMGDVLATRPEASTLLLNPTVTHPLVCPAHTAAADFGGTLERMFWSRHPPGSNLGPSSNFLGPSTNVLGPSTIHYIVCLLGVIISFCLVGVRPVRWFGRRPVPRSADPARSPCIGTLQPYGGMHLSHTHHQSTTLSRTRIAFAAFAGCRLEFHRSSRWSCHAPPRPRQTRLLVRTPDRPASSSNGPPPHRPRHRVPSTGSLLRPK